jgi:hypothetical protein
VTDLSPSGFASAPSLFSDDVSNVIARDRINHRRYQFIRPGGVAAFCFTNIFYSLVLQFEQVLVTGNLAFPIEVVRVQLRFVGA